MEDYRPATCPFKYRNGKEMLCDFDCAFAYCESSHDVYPRCFLASAACAITSGRLNVRADAYVTIDE